MLKYFLFSFFPISSLIFVVYGFSYDIKNGGTGIEELAWMAIVLALILTFLNFFIYKTLFWSEKIEKIAIPMVFFVIFSWLLYCNIFPGKMDLGLLFLNIFSILLFSVLGLLFAQVFIWILKKFLKNNYDY